MKIRRIADKNEAQKKRVAAYARVSTASEEQQTSFDTQVGYYEKLIRQNPKFQYIGIYADATDILGLKQNPTKRASL